MSQMVKDPAFLDNWLTVVPVLSGQTLPKIQWSVRQRHEELSV